jgi:hypothetical protein
MKRVVFQTPLQPLYSWRFRYDNEWQPRLIKTAVFSMVAHLPISDKGHKKERKGVAELVSELMR